MKQTRREFVRVLFVASQAAVASRFLPSAFAQDAAPESGGLRFIVFGDWGRKGQKEQLEVAAQMGVAASANGAKFVISVGDNFYTDGVASVTDKHWHESFENVYSAESLQVPWYVALGNHDYRGNCDVQIEYSKTSPRWRMPARHFIQSQQLDAATSADFFYIDTSPMLKAYHKDPIMGPHVATQDVAQQMDWLKSALAESKAQWKIVVGHHPIYSGGGHGDTKELVELLLPVLRENKVQAYFFGHDHNLQHLMADDLHLFCSGAGSTVNLATNTPHTKFAKMVPGFSAVALHADKMTVRMIDGSGNLLYTATVPRVSA